MSSPQEPPVPPPVAPQDSNGSSPLNHRDAKAHARAAKAYAKAQRPWYKKKRFILLAIVVVIVVIIIAANAGGGSKSTNSSSTAGTATGTSASTKGATAKPTATNSAADGGKALPIQNGDWRLDSLRVVNDGLGSFGATARVTYTGKDDAGGTNLFTVTVFKGGKDIAVLNGSATSVAPGSTATVQFISTDKFAAGPYTYDFQNDL